MSNDEDGCIPYVVSGLFLVLMVVLITVGINDGLWRRAAVRQGAAEYILDPMTGKSAWQCKTRPAATESEE